MARPTKYSDEKAAKIIQAIELGAAYHLAASYAGIHYETFLNWRKRYSSFSTAVTEAEGRAAVTWLAKIEREATNGDWRAASWKLERRYPHDYGRTVQEQQHTGKDGGPIEFAGIDVPLPTREDDPPA